jgi:hypothetical protein
MLLCSAVIYCFRMATPLASAMATVSAVNPADNACGVCAWWAEMERNAVHQRGHTRKQAALNFTRVCAPSGLSADSEYFRDECARA